MASAEALLISAVLREQDYETALKDSVTSEMFHAYADEWTWLERFYTKHRKTPSVLAFRKKFGDFRISNVNDVAHFIEEVRTSHARHVLTSVMHQCTEYIAEGDIDRAVSYMSLQMNKVATTMGAMSDLNVIDDWEKTFDDATFRRQRFEQFGMAGMPTGFTIVDNRTGGIQPGQYWVLAARLGQKKSWCVTHMAVAALIAGYNVHQTVLEQSGIEVSMRAHNFLSGAVGKRIFESQALMMGEEPNLSDYKTFLRSLRGHIKSNFTVSDKRGIGVPEFRAQIERNKPDLWILDHITLAKGAGSGEWQDVAAISTEINNIAGEYNIGVVAAAQLNRQAANERGPAGSETIGGSDKIGQDAHAVITTKQLSSSVNMFRLDKLRNGRGGARWYAHFDPSRGVFEEVNRERAMELRDLDRVRDGEEE